MSGLLPEQHEGLTGVRAEQDSVDAVRPQGSPSYRSQLQFEVAFFFHYLFCVIGVRQIPYK